MWVLLSSQLISRNPCGIGLGVAVGIGVTVAVGTTTSVGIAVGIGVTAVGTTTSVGIAVGIGATAVATTTSVGVDFVDDVETWAVSVSDPPEHVTVRINAMTSKKILRNISSQIRIVFIWLLRIYLKALVMTILLFLVYGHIRDKYFCILYMLNKRENLKQQSICFWT